MSLRSILSEAENIYLRATTPAVPRLTPNPAPGSAWWLHEAEKRYGGHQTFVPRNKVSPVDPREPEELKVGGMFGGDRMCPDIHNYAPFYERHLRAYIGRPIVIVEVGILRGQGLAMWSELFPDGTVIGLDIDLGHVESERPTLVSRGAFKVANVETAVFDQYLGTAADVERILGGRKADIVIDDGCHTRPAIINTFRCLRPFLADRFTYICEDNLKATRYLKPFCKGLHIDRQGYIMAVSNWAEG
jgi:hypothetical protein